MVVEWDASTDRYLFQVVAPSAAACEAQFGPWALFKVKAANIQTCFHPGRSATAKALATPAAPRGHGATASTRDGHGNTSTSAFAGQGRVDGQGQAASSQFPPPAPAALEYITDLAMVAPEMNAEMEATLVSNMEDVGKKVDFALDTWVDLPGRPGPMIKFTENLGAPPHFLYSFIAERHFRCTSGEASTIQR